MTDTIHNAADIIASELKVDRGQILAAITLLDDGATVPFIARYRKEATKGLDDTQLRLLQERLHYLRELDARREVILKSIAEQDKLSSELKQSILAADTKARLEDLYLPYKPKRKTKASIAIEAGLEPLAKLLLGQPAQEPLLEAQAFIRPEAGIEDATQALDGARSILIELFAEQAALLDHLREYLWKHALLHAKGSKEKDTHNKYLDYYDYAEAIAKIPSHRALALFRGRRETALTLSLKLPESHSEYGQQKIAQHFDLNLQAGLAKEWLNETVQQAWSKRIFNKLELELFARVREKAEDEAIRVFARNLRDLLLAAPAGAKATMGLDPGIRTGVKIAVVDDTGKLLDFSTIYPLAPKNEWHESIIELAKLASRHHVRLISIGNGTGSRETERLVSEMCKMYSDLSLKKLTVSEAGASVYSASELAATEFPDLDVSIRGAVSIARRLQDPLAELVKIEPKSIGVGQYQHDVNQTKLARSLEAVVEDCVNLVGVELNTASEALLSRVSGLNKKIAGQIVKLRDEAGSFTSREALKAVPGLGEKSFEQAAGFLRILNGEHPLDATAVHPEAYPLVETMLSQENLKLQDLIANKQALKAIKPENYVNAEFGLIAIRDVLSELEKPGRDPRPDFKTVEFKEGVEEIGHLEEGMVLDGVVSNVTNFGAFVDIGVHQDGLVHISSMTNRFVNDPHQVVKAGDIVKVKVTGVDKARRRISLSMNLEEKLQSKPAQEQRNKREEPKKKAKSADSRNATQNKKPKAAAKPKEAPKKTVFNTAMADALAKLKKGVDVNE